MATIGTPKSECFIASTPFRKGSQSKSASGIPILSSRRLVLTPPTPVLIEKKKSLPTRRKVRIGDGKKQLASKSNMAVSYLYHAGCGDSEKLCKCAPVPDTSNTKSSCLILNACQEEACRWKREHCQEYWSMLLGMMFKLVSLLTVVAVLCGVHYFSYCMWHHYYGSRTNEYVQQLPILHPEPQYKEGSPGIIEGNRTNGELVDIFANRNSFDLTEPRHNWSMFAIIRNALGSIFSWMGSFFWLEAEEE